MPTEGLNRRQFLAALSLAAAASRSANAVVGADPDVVIIGAGMAGISAAHTLIAGGRTVTVLEALPRIGGRAYTDRTSLGLTFDRGAAYLGAANRNPLAQMAKRFKFTLAEHDPDELVYAGTTPAPAERQKAFQTATEQVMGALEEASEGLDADIGADQALKDLFTADPTMRLAATTAVIANAGADLSDISLKDWSGHGAGFPFLAVTEGVGTLVQRIADGLPIAVNTKVTGIRERGKALQIITPKGALSAKAVIITVSPAVLASGAIRIETGLPDKIADAAANLAMGHLEKVAMRLSPDAPTPQSELMIVPETASSQAAYLHVRPYGLPMIVHYAAGGYAKALTQAGPAAAIDAGKAAVTAAFGGKAVQAITGATATNWGTDPLFLGAFAAAKPGQLPARLTLSKPFSDRIFLAGEAMGDTRAQSLDGAWRSGERTAQAALIRMKRG